MTSLSPTRQGEGALKWMEGKSRTQRRKKNVVIDEDSIVAAQNFEIFISFRIHRCLQAAAGPLTLP